jgi:hypothetical protein
MLAFEVLRVVVVKSTIMLVVTLCSLEDVGALLPDCMAFISQKTVIFIVITVRTSNPNVILYEKPTLCNSELLLDYMASHPGK